MDRRTLSPPRLDPTPPNPELSQQYEAYKKSLGFVPNSILIMQRSPAMVKAFAQLGAAVWDPKGKVDRGFKRLIAYMASQAAGCRYCMAHTVGGALHFGVDERKVDALWDYQTSPLFSEAERIALDVAAASAMVPNGVSDDMFAELRRHWSDDEIVEIVGAIAIMGFLNRWNDTMATPLEEEPIEVGEKVLAPRGWDIGKHARETATTATPYTGRN
jgi:uncharacterized peroxidase-related enzyme